MTDALAPPYDAAPTAAACVPETGSALLTPSSPSNLERHRRGHRRAAVLRAASRWSFPSARARGVVPALPRPGPTPSAQPTCGRRCSTTSIAGVLTVVRRLRLATDARGVRLAGLDAVSPKVVVGYSDVTGAARGPGEPARLVVGDGTDGRRGRVPRSPTRSPRCGPCLTSPETLRTASTSRDARTLVGGIAEGITAGGNLSLLTGSVGTDDPGPRRAGSCSSRTSTRTTPASTSC